MNQRYFIVCGNYEQFRDFSKKKHQELTNSGILVEITDFIYATVDSIRGHRNPRGWFYGTWRERSDIGDILTLLMVSTDKPSETLLSLYVEYLENLKIV